MPILTRGTEARSMSIDEARIRIPEGWQLMPGTYTNHELALLTTPPENNVTVFEISKASYRDPTRRKGIAIGSKRYVFKKTCDNPSEGWAKLLNLMRTFIKLKKSHAVDKAKKGWVDADHDIEYLFRAFGLGYTAERFPTIFNHIKPTFPDQMFIVGGYGRALIELSDRKAKLIGQAIIKIINDKKCFKELLQNRDNFLALADEMIAVGTPRHLRTSIQHSRMVHLGEHPHIYIFYANA